MQDTTTKHGFVDETNEEYHAGEGISKSHLDVIYGGSPRHYWHRYLNPNREPKQPTPDLIFGQAVHTALLEPHLFEMEYAQEPTDAPRRPSSKQINAKKPSAETVAAIEWWDTFNASIGNRTLLSAKDWQRCFEICDAVHSHPVAGGLLCDGRAEQSCYATDDETGALIKCRVDYLADDLIVDLKTTADASPAEFGRSCLNYRYPVQTAWYYHVLASAFGNHPANWVFLAVEKEPPYAIGLYFPDDDLIERGRIAAMRDFAAILSCRKAQNWPDYAEQINPVLFPSYGKL